VRAFSGSHSRQDVSRPLLQGAVARAHGDGQRVRGDARRLGQVTAADREPGLHVQHLDEGGQVIRGTSTFGLVPGQAGDGVVVPAPEGRTSGLAERHRGPLLSGSSLGIWSRDLDLGISSRDLSRARTGTHNDHSLHGPA